MILTDEQEEAAGRAERIRTVATWLTDNMAEYGADVLHAVALEILARAPLPARKSLLQQAAAEMLRMTKAAR